MQARHSTTSLQPQHLLSATPQARPDPRAAPDNHGELPNLDLAHHASPSHQQQSLGVQKAMPQAALVEHRYSLDPVLVPQSLAEMPLLGVKACADRSK